ncbi:unnamed protein product [Cunninghamella echinulata]
MLYEQVKKDIFSHNELVMNNHNNHNDNIHPPSVTTIVLLQVQASMIQVISKLHGDNKKPIQSMVKLPLRWGLLVGLLVVDNVARVLHVDEEMANLQQQSDHPSQQQQPNTNPTSSFSSSDDDNESTTSSILDNHRHTQFNNNNIPQKSYSSTIPKSSSSSSTLHIYPSTSTGSLSTTSPSSPLLAAPPLPILLKSSDGLRVRSRKISSPPVLNNQQKQQSTTTTTTTTFSSQPKINGVRQRSISNNLHDGGNRLQQHTVRRVNAQRELKVISPSVSSSTSNVIRRQTSIHNLNDVKVKRVPSTTKKSKS